MFEPIPLSLDSGLDGPTYVFSAAYLLLTSAIGGHAFLQWLGFIDRQPQSLLAILIAAVVFTLTLVAFGLVSISAYRAGQSAHEQG